MDAGTLLWILKYVFLVAGPSLWALVYFLRPSLSSSGVTASATAGGLSCLRTIQNGGAPVSSDPGSHAPPVPEDEAEAKGTARWSLRAPHPASLCSHCLVLPLSLKASRLRDYLPSIQKNPSSQQRLPAAGGWGALPGTEHKFLSF